MFTIYGVHHLLGSLSTGIHHLQWFAINSYSQSTEVHDLQVLTIYRGSPTTGKLPFLKGPALTIHWGSTSSKVHHLLGLTINWHSSSTSSPPADVHHPEGFTILKALPSTGVNDQPVLTIYCSSPSADVHHLQAFTILKVSPSTEVHHPQGKHHFYRDFTMYKGSPSTGVNHLQGFTIYEG